ncbi:hypothetical protein ABBQ38_012658 [Trebouxia sp. C0009 RCD-2024]
MPDPACSTSMGEGRTADTNDQPPVTVSRAQRPYFMTEYVAGSGEYLRAFVVDENSSDVRLRFPACKETKNKDEVVWVSRCSSRLWRRSNAKDAWTKVATGEGAWRPKKRKGAAGKPSRKKSAKLEDGTRHTPTAEQAEDLSPQCLEGSAECPDRGETNMASSQEFMVLHDLPSDALAAWFYKDAEASVELNLSSTKQMGDNTGCEAGEKAHTAGPTLERDDSAMEEAWSQSLQSVSRPSTTKPSAFQSSHAPFSAVPATLVKAYM